jgi:hypothetical protein
MCKHKEMSDGPFDLRCTSCRHNALDDHLPLAMPVYPASVFTRPKNPTFYQQLKRRAREVGASIKDVIPGRCTKNKEPKKCGIQPAKYAKERYPISRDGSAIDDRRITEGLGCQLKRSNAIKLRPKWGYAIVKSIPYMNIRQEIGDWFGIQRHESIAVDESAYYYEEDFLGVGEVEEYDGSGLGEETEDKSDLNYGEDGGRERKYGRWNRSRWPSDNDLKARNWEKEHR